MSELYAALAENTKIEKGSSYAKTTEFVQVNKALAEKLEENAKHPTYAVALADLKQTDKKAADRLDAAIKRLDANSRVMLAYVTRIDENSGGLDAANSWEELRQTVKDYIAHPDKLKKEFTKQVNQERELLTNYIETGGKLGAATEKPLNPALFALSQSANKGAELA